MNATPTSGPHVSASEPRFVFVVGSPRSGTTLIGALLGSAPSFYQADEYFGFYAAYEILPSILGRIPSPLRTGYLRSVQAHARTFAVETARQARTRYFCDATPWNLMVAAKLAAALPDSSFVLCVRRPEGVVQSLQRSYALGMRWAGESPAQRAKVYADFYGHIPELPRDRTIVFDYDACCASPEGELNAFLRRVAAVLDEDTSSFDLAAAAVPHASSPGSLPPLATTSPDGGLEFHARESFDAAAWTAEDHDSTWRIVQPALSALRRLCADTVAASL